jgi:uncharacterized protein
MAAVKQRNAYGAPLRAPGVYIEEIVPEQAPAFRTGVPVFVGFAAEGRAGSDLGAGQAATVCRLTRWEEFAERVGRAIPGGFLGYAVRGFFENGGESCVVMALRESQPRSTALTQVFSPGGLLDSIEDVDLVCGPDISLGDVRQSRELVFTLQKQVLEHCQRMGDRFAILDAIAMADHEHSIQAGVRASGIERAIEHWQELLPTDGALYYPWIRVEPFAGEDSGVVPPCGHIAGIYARTDAQFGVHKAPANEIVEGALDLEVQLTDEEQSRLNDIGVNCIRSFPRRGIRVWGARTLSGLPNWRYVHVRRLFLTLTRWIEQHMRDVVFEPNGPPLWARVRDRLGAYCNELFQRGALKGARPAEGFFVKCDAETNPREVREAGQLICNIGLAPIMPAEFIVVRLTQSAAGTTVMLPIGA